MCWARRSLDDAARAGVLTLCRESAPMNSSRHLLDGRSTASQILVLQEAPALRIDDEPGERAHGLRLFIGRQGGAVHQAAALLLHFDARARPLEGDRDAAEPNLYEGVLIIVRAACVRLALEL